MKSPQRLLPFVFVAYLLSACGLTAREETPDSPTTTRTVAIDRWLIAGPVPLTPPARLDAPAPAPEPKKSQPDDKADDPAAELLLLDHLDVTRLNPRAAERVYLPGAPSAEWQEGVATFGSDDADDGVEQDGSVIAQVAWLAARIRSDRFTKAKLSLSSRQLLRVWLDGDEVAQRTKSGPERTKTDQNKDGDPVTADLTLDPGSHLLLIKTIASSPELDGWSIEASLKQEEEWSGAELTVGTSPERMLAESDLLDTPEVTSVLASPSGRFVALAYRLPPVPADHVERWVEIIDALSGHIVFSTEGTSALSSFQWIPGSDAFSYVTRRDGKSTIWRATLDGRRRSVLEDVEHLGRHEWLRDGSSIVYAVTDKAEDDDRGVHRMRDIPDRWPTFRDVSHLYQAATETMGGPSGAGSGTNDGIRRLTFGDQDVSLHDVHPRGTHVLFSTQTYGLTTRPFFKAELFELDLETLRPKRILETSTLESASYSPDGKSLLVVAGPSFSGAGGSALDAPAIPNDYDQQAYFVDRESGAIDAFTRAFDPSVLQAVISKSDGNVYLRAEDGTRVSVFRFDVASRRFERLQDLGADVAGPISLADDSAFMAYSGTSSSMPPRILARRLGGDDAPMVLAKPGYRTTWNDIEFGEVKEWTFTTQAGDELDGFVYYPPDFDAAQRYPLIVYYYGGTSPTSRSFGGRYPKELWAAHGYVVYVLNPSGATGYGQEFSARHINNWGITVADEIIAGTRAFLDAHAFVDPKRVGCIGASYGGFMTMLLVTRTDLYASAVSHAGISSLSSYWGEGFWGYLYSAIATADSYPWNRRDLYVDQSPLFAADKITTPLLLLHGASDTNVPVGESEQMYTALKVLGREVEFLKFDDEDHHILQKSRRALWTRSILAWFDRTLKDQPQWWDHLYED